LAQKGGKEFNLKLATRDNSVPEEGLGIATGKGRGGRRFGQAVGDFVSHALPGGKGGGGKCG